MRFRIPIAWLLTLALATAVNLHLPAMQVVAWTGMIVDYSRGNSLSEAVAMTFDGDHPCRMCKEIRKQQTPSAEEEIQTAQQSSRLVAVLGSVPAWVHALVPLAAPAELRPLPVGLRPVPETPPPRSAHG